MKNYEVEILTLEQHLKEEYRTVEEYDTALSGYLTPRMVLAVKNARFNLINKKRNLQIMKSKQILFNMQNGAR